MTTDRMSMIAKLAVCEFHGIPTEFRDRISVSPWVSRPDLHYRWRYSGCDLAGAVTISPGMSTVTVSCKGVSRQYGIINGECKPVSKPLQHDWKQVSDAVYRYGAVDYHIMTCAACGATGKREIGSSSVRVDFRYWKWKAKCDGKPVESLYERRNGKRGRKKRNEQSLQDQKQG